MARVASNEDPDQLYTYIDARADAADKYEEQERTPDEIATHAREQRLIRWLIGMVALIVIGGFVISISLFLLLGPNAG